MAQHFGKWGGRTAEEHATDLKKPEDIYVRLGDVLDYLRTDEDRHPELVKKLLKKFGEE